MRKFAWTVFATLFLSLGLLGADISYKDEVRTYNYTDFNRIEVASDMHITITQSDSYSIEVKAGSSDFKRLRVKKSGSTLEFYMDNGWFHSFRGSDVYINVKMPKMTGVELSGGSEARILKMEVPSETFKADLSGGAILQGTLKCGNISMELSGGSRITLSGTGGDMKIDGSGGSKFMLKDFAAHNLNSDLSGGASAVVNLNGMINTSQSGGSHITYYGNAKPGKTHFSGGAGMEAGE